MALWLLKFSYWWVALYFNNLFILTLVFFLNIMHHSLLYRTKNRLPESQVYSNINTSVFYFERPVILSLPSYDRLHDLLCSDGNWGSTAAAAQGNPAWGTFPKHMKIKSDCSLWPKWVYLVRQHLVCGWTPVIGLSEDPHTLPLFDFFNAEICTKKNWKSLFLFRFIKIYLFQNKSKLSQTNKAVSQWTEIPFRLAETHVGAWCVWEGSSHWLQQQLVGERG